MAAVTSVAVVAHTSGRLDGGLAELRAALAERGVRDPQWHQVEKSRDAGQEVKRALGDGAELIFAWGGDGLVQRCVDALAQSSAALAIVPAGTSNVLATSLGVPHEISGAVDTGLRGERRKLDVGHMNGERFGAMAGLGFDAEVMRATGERMKHIFGRIAYVWAALKFLDMKPFEARVLVDGDEFYSGPATVILFGNVGRIFGLNVFEDARTDDGLIEVGVGNARGIGQWVRTIARKHIATSPYVHMTRARSVEVRVKHKVRYELDGGERTKEKAFSVGAEAGGVTICVPKEV